MSERVPRVSEFDPVTAIAGALHHWLQAEIKSSMSSKNRVLDDWATYQRKLRLPFDDYRNQDAGKARCTMIV